MPSDRHCFSFLVAGMDGAPPGWPVLSHLAEENAGTVSIGKRQLIRAGGQPPGSVIQIDPVDPGDGGSATPNRVSVSAWALPPW